MKQYFLYILAIPFLLNSCQKTPINGDLDGQWCLLDQYTRTSSDSDYSNHYDKRSECIYWAFQLQLLSLRNTTAEFMARFAHSENRLIIDKIYIHGRDNDELITDANTTIFESVGIRSNATNFDIRRLDGSSLILTNDTDSLVFKKLN